MNTYLIVTLPKTVKIPIPNANREEEIDMVEIFQLIDSPAKKTVVAICKHFPTVIPLWEGATYDAIGQWTDLDVINRILEIYTTT